MKPSGLSRFRLLPCAIALAALMLWGCSSTRHVPDGQFLLDNVDITIDNDSIDVRDLYYFLRQVPNHKVLGFLKLQLATYNLSGRDSTKSINRWIRSLGKPPVIYDPDLTDKSARQLRQALINRGYMDATVIIDTVSRHDKKMDVNYIIQTGRPKRIASIAFDIADPDIRTLVLTDSTLSTIHPGDLLDRNRLDDYRTAITRALKNNGYYSFNKDLISFTADTVRGSDNVALTLNIRPGTQTSQQAVAMPEYATYLVKNVYFQTNYSPDAVTQAPGDTIAYKGLDIIYGNDRYLRPAVLHEKCYIRPGEPFSAIDVERTYEALGQLGIVKYLNIELRPAGTFDGHPALDAYILMSRNKKQAITLEVEGTNSEGDLGFGAGIIYQHRDLARGSELLTAKFRAAYESLSGNFEGLVNNRYTEYAGEVGILFPKFKFPFLPTRLKQRVRANTEFAISANYQERPEYTRIIGGAAWKYKWAFNRGAVTDRHVIDLIDINYVKLPKSTLDFLDQIAPANPLLRYSYEDHFITRIGYSYYHTDRRLPSPDANAFAVQPSVTTFRASTELAGNLLYGVSELLGRQKHDGAYRIFGIQFAQYFKGEVQYSYTRNFNDRNALAFRIGAGLAVPYGNSSMVPFEKRFYAGGANSVRGWGVRSLGPGSYDSSNSVTDFINQCGDILLNISLEYRAKLFWVFEGALFIDGGNIWTIRNYENQPGGLFRFNSFYKEIAAAYGLGLRMDFTYFLLRFDLGIKAHNPALGQEPWPLLNPSWKRDATFHFTVGYPF